MAPHILEPDFGTTVGPPSGVGRCSTAGESHAEPPAPITSETPATNHRDHQGLSGSSPQKASSSPSQTKASRFYKGLIGRSTRLKRTGTDRLPDSLGSSPDVDRLFGPQGFHRIDGRRALRGYVGGQQRRQPQHDSYSRQGCDIPRANPE